MKDILFTILKCVIAYLILLCVSRIVGRKALSQMTFFDFAVGITFGSLAARITVDGSHASYISGIAIILFAILAVLTDILLLKSLPLSRLINSQPIVIIAKGELIKANLQRVRLTMNMLNSLLREKNIFHISDVEYAIFENDGKLSVLPKSNKQPLTPSDMSIATPYKDMMMELIVDGVLIEGNLERIQKDKVWLMNELNKRGIGDIRDVYYAAFEANAGLYLSLGFKP